MTIRVSRRFIKQRKKLPPPVEKKLKRQIKRLVENREHPSLNIKKMRARDDIYEARIDYHYRMTFQINDDVLILRQVGTHQIYDTKS